MFASWFVFVVEGHLEMLLLSLEVVAAGRLDLRKLRSLENTWIGGSELQIAIAQADLLFLHGTEGNAREIKSLLY